MHFHHLVEHVSAVAGDAQIVHCHGGIDCPFRSTPESRLQADFAQAVGIWCHREAREQLEELMSKHRFTGRDLALAWKESSLIWRNDRLAVYTPWFEGVFGWSMFAFMLAFYLAMALPFVISGQRDISGFAAITAATAVYLGTAWLIGRHILRPRRVAHRVRKALAL